VSTAPSRTGFLSTGCSIGDPNRAPARPRDRRGEDANGEKSAHLRHLGNPQK
jgi:hypothetical protein